MKFWTKKEKEENGKTEKIGSAVENGKIVPLD
jgi:hypothetical protein